MVVTIYLSASVHQDSGTKSISVSIEGCGFMLERVKSMIAKVPIPVAGVALGLVALGNLLQPYSVVFHIVLGCCSFFMMLLLTAKLVVYPQMIRADFSNPIFASVSATYCMTLMQLAGYIAPVFPLPARVVWSMAVTAHVVLIIWFTVRFFRHFKLEDVFPTYYICYVGIVVASVTSPALGTQDIGRFIFWFGFALYLVMLALVTVRYLRIPVPESARPLFCIYAAPMSLSLAGYLSVYEHPSLMFAAILAVSAQVLLVMVVSRLPQLLRLPFYPSYAAMTFPFVISAIALGKTLAAFSSAGFAVPDILSVLSDAEIVLASVMVLYVFGRYLHWLFRDLVKVPTSAGESASVKSAKL